MENNEEARRGMEEKERDEEKCEETEEKEAQNKEKIHVMQCTARRNICVIHYEDKILLSMQ
jgi:hypothetical protein